MTNREIDALVAEKVMGYRFVQNRSHSGIRQVEAIPPTGPNEPILTNAVRVDHSAWEGAWQISNVPAYSTDIAAAFEVVDKVPSGKEFFISRMGDSFPPERVGKWRVVVEGVDGEFVDASPALAICLAALQAVGVVV